MPTPKVPLTRPQDEWSDFKRVDKSDKSEDFDPWQPSTTYEWSQEEMYRVNTRATNSHDHAGEIPRVRLPFAMLGWIRAVVSLRIPGMMNEAEVIRYCIGQGTRFVLSHKDDFFEIYRLEMEAEESRCEVEAVLDRENNLREDVEMYRKALSSLKEERNTKAFQIVIIRAKSRYENLGPGIHKDQLKRILEDHGIQV